MSTVKRLHQYRLSRQLRRAEHHPIGEAVPRMRGPQSTFACGKVAKTGGSGIPAMSGTTPGSATVTLYEFDVDAVSLAAGDTVTAYHIGSTAVGNNKFIQVKWIDGGWFVDVESC